MPRLQHSLVMTTHIHSCSELSTAVCKFDRSRQERIKGTEKASSIHTLFHR